MASNAVWAVRSCEIWSLVNRGSAKNCSKGPTQASKASLQHTGTLLRQDRNDRFSGLGEDASDE